MQRNNRINKLRNTNCTHGRANSVICTVLGLTFLGASMYVSNMDLDPDVQKPLYYGFISAAGISGIGTLYHLGQYARYRCGTNTNINEVDVTSPCTANTLI